MDCNRNVFSNTEENEFAHLFYTEDKNMTFLTVAVIQRQVRTLFWVMRLGVGRGAGVDA